MTVELEWALLRVTPSTLAHDRPFSSITIHNGSNGHSILDGTVHLRPLKNQPLWTITVHFVSWPSTLIHSSPYAHLRDRPLSIHFHRKSSESYFFHQISALSHKIKILKKFCCGFKDILWCSGLFWYRNYLIANKLRK